MISSEKNRFDDPLVSVITVSLNSASTIKDTIASVNRQSYGAIEQIFVDGGSTDATLALISSCGKSNKKVISEPDKGIYDAMNKGVNMASGSLICFLNSDDEFVDSDVISSVVECFQDKEPPFIYANITHVNRENKVVRRWVVGEQSFRLKWAQPQLPHPGLFISSSCLRAIPGPFDAGMRISADLKLQLQLVEVSDGRQAYLNKMVVRQRIGGASNENWKAQILGWKECAKAWRDVYGGLGLVFVAQKLLRKLIQIRSF